MDKNKVHWNKAVEVLLHAVYSGTQDTLFQDCKRMLFNCDLEILKQMWPEVCIALNGFPRLPYAHLIQQHFKSNLFE